MRRLLRALAVLVLGLAVTLAVALTAFLHSEREVSIGAHSSLVRPTLDGWATLDFGPLLPTVRVPVDGTAGIGVEIDLGDSQVTSLEQLAAQDAVIASQPAGEVRKVTATVQDMAWVALAKGAGAGVLTVLLAVGVWRATGPQRRREVRRTVQERLRHPSRRTVLGGVVVTALVAGSVVAIALPVDDADVAGDRSWRPITAVFPELEGTDPVLDTVQIAQGAAASGGSALVEGALATYRESVSFYGDLAETASEAVVRTPEEGETTALVVTDRHDNIGMDQVARALADRAEASMVLDLGDDTSVGGSWEEFSVNSLAREMRDLEVVAIAGNHDTGGHIQGWYRDAGFTVLDGEPVDVEGVRFIGVSDPRSSGLTSGYEGDAADNSAALKEQDEALTEAACEDGDVSVALVHSASSAKQLAASGCVDLVLSGHLHRQVGPDVVEGENGRRTVTLTTASTGGAVYAFALGSKLRRAAQVTIVTFRDGRPVGLQPVDLEPGGIVTVQDFVPVTPSPRDAVQALR
jgi:predicted phosphodiesterase